MKRYPALILIALLPSVVLFSMLYRAQRTNVFFRFDKEHAQLGQPVLCLYGFFSSSSCAPCGELIGVLNQLPDGFRVKGVVPQTEVPRIPQLREEYQIRFPIYGAAKYRRYTPLVVPSIMGVSAGGRVLFVLPCPTLRPEEIRTFLEDFYRKMTPYLADPSF